MKNLLVILGCCSAALGVAAGAFGAHGLKSMLSPDILQTYETAVRYHMYHAFGLIAAGLLSSASNESKVRLAGYCFITGTVVFSGSLYALTLTGIRWFGAATPFGGIAFIAGWIVLAIAAYQQVK
jgi:uncharacterized membrane protein YgdD (TMEM256/DUF423 family)